MIAVRDLQIGDFINTENNGVVQITVLSWKGVGYEGGASTPEHCSYIPLTEDILVKNGFSEIHHPGTGATDEYSEWFFGGIKIIEWLEDWKYHYFSAGGDGAPIDFQYVHQLQHLLRLCGIEKELTI